VIQPCAVCQAPVPVNEVEVCNICLSVMHDTCEENHKCESRPINPQHAPLYRITSESSAPVIIMGSSPILHGANTTEAYADLKNRYHQLNYLIDGVAKGTVIIRQDFGAEVIDTNPQARTFYVDMRREKDGPTPEDEKEVWP
jgi:hypothetical protein